jgi:hypothetical protein
MSPFKKLAKVELRSRALRGISRDNGKPLRVDGRAAHGSRRR